MQRDPYPISTLKTMEEHGVVPDVIDAAPQGILEIKFGNHELKMGNILTPTQVQNKPTHIFYVAESGAFYTLYMTDLDVPSRKEPKCRECNHWLIINIPGNEVSKGDVLSDYIGSGPLQGTGLHRYVYLVYKQQNKITSDEPKLENNSLEKRSNFKIKNFAKKYNLGEPIAGNFYQAEWDDYVPKLYENLRN
uniref:Phosphatidylethanolamine-binding protein n=1 Tax=Strigamia maritima TaxID=126957 RepID=T1IIP5_STRMM